MTGSVVALLPAAYLLGTFPSAALVARASGIDITAVGSGNPGASNVTRTLGWRKGAAVFALDALKGALAAGLGLVVDGRGTGYALGAAAVVGHLYPLARRFRGGKGVATAAGVIAMLQPFVALAAAAGWFAAARLTRKAALGSLAGAVVIPLGTLAGGRPAWEVAATVALSALVIVRHAANFRRIARGTEHPI
jgi:glycerol-3-phosphate acyltransferase PlsY